MYTLNVIQTSDGASVEQKVQYTRAKCILYFYLNYDPKKYCATIEEFDDVPVYVYANKQSGPDHKSEEPEDTIYLDALGGLSDGDEE